MAHKPVARTPQPAPMGGDADLVSDLHRQARRRRVASDSRIPNAATPAGKASSLRVSDDQATRRRHAIRSLPARSPAPAETETGPFMIVRGYEPASDLEQRLSRIYALLSLPATEPLEEHEIQ